MCHPPGVAPVAAPVRRVRRRLLPHPEAPTLFLETPSPSPCTHLVLGDALAAALHRDLALLVRLQPLDRLRQVPVELVHLLAGDAVLVVQLVHLVAQLRDLRLRRRQLVQQLRVLQATAAYVTQTRVYVTYCTVLIRQGETFAIFANFNFVRILILRILIVCEFQFHANLNFMQI